MKRILNGGSPIVRLAIIALAFVAMLSLMPHHAGAQSLNDARAAGQIGEGADGLAVLRQGNAPAAVKQLVQTVNAQRRKIYAKRAAEQRVPAAQVGKLYAGQIAGKAPKGTWIQATNGTWRRK